MGGISYILTSQGDTTSYNSIANCIYLKDGDDHARFCFAQGHEEVECKDDATDPMTGTNNQMQKRESIYYIILLYCIVVGQIVH